MYSDDTTTTSDKWSTLIFGEMIPSHYETFIPGLNNGKWGRKPDHPQESRRAWSSDLSLTARQQLYDLWKLSKQYFSLLISKVGIIIVDVSGINERIK